jgi:ArsR family transcriptional regulator
MKDHGPACKASDHGKMEDMLPPLGLERAAEVLRAMADAARLRILALLKPRELCVTEIVAALGEKFTTISQRLRLLRREGLVVRRREGNHLYYALADRHVVDLILNALAHAMELDAVPARSSSQRED